MPDNFRTRFFLSIFRHKALVLSGFVIATGLFIFVAAGMNLKEDIMDLLPSHDPVVKKYKTVLTSFHSFDYMLIDVGPEVEGSVPPRDELVRAADTLVEKMSASSYFNDIQYRLVADDMMSSFGVLKLHRASLFTEEDKRALEERLRTESIRETFRGWKRLLTESPAPFLADSFNNDPLAIDTILLKKLDDFKSMGGEVKMDDGRIFSKDMKHIFIIAQPVYPGTDSRHARELIDFMDRTILETKTVSPGLINIAYMGSHRFGLDNADMIKRDIRMTLSLSAGSIAILALLAFRRPFVMSLLTMLPAFFGGVFASCMIMLVYPGVSAIAIGCGAMLLGIAVDFGIHFLYHADQVSAGDTSRSDIIHILDKLTKPLMLTGATTLIAFLTLELSVLPGYRQLGLFAVFGIAGAFIFALIALPLLIPRAKSTLRHPVINLTVIYPMFFRWVKGHRKVLIIIVAALSITSAVGIYRLEFEGDIQKLNAVYPDTKKDWDTVIGSFGGMLDSTSVVVKGKDLEEALQRNEMLYSRLRDMREQGKVQGSNSIAPLFPSRSRQEENRQRWKDFWSRERLDRVMNEVEKISMELRIRPESVREELSRLPGPMPPLELEGFNSGILRTVAANQISFNADGVMIMTNLQSINVSEYANIASVIEDSVPGAIMTNGRHFVQHIVGLIHREMMRLGGVTLFFVAAAMVFYSRRLSSFVSLMLPLFLSLFWTFGIMGWLGIKINIMNAMIVIFIFGIVDDYSVFLHEAWNHSASGNDTHLSHTSGAITLSAITTFLGLGSLVFARHPALHSIGATAILGITFGLASVFLTVPLRGHKTGHVDFTRL
ncbi:MAG: MMPL family transporter [Nitrospirae bacterium]|nr:MMPL family transporter [Nitrospirota bacterium]